MSTKKRTKSEGQRLILDFGLGDDFVIVTGENQERFVGIDFRHVVEKERSDWREQRCPGDVRMIIGEDAENSHDRMLTRPIQMIIRQMIRIDARWKTNGNIISSAKHISARIKSNRDERFAAAPYRMSSG